MSQSSEVSGQVDDRSMLDSGFTIARFAGGVGYYTATDELAYLERKYRGLEIRDARTGTDHDRARLQVVSSRELEWQDVAVSTIAATVIKAVPSLRESRKVIFNELTYLPRNERNEAHYVLHARDQDVSEIYDERQDTLRALGSLGIKTMPRRDTDRPPDLTIAYAPPRFSNYRVQRIAEAIEEVLPIFAILEPASMPGLSKTSPSRSY